VKYDRENGNDPAGLLAKFNAHDWNDEAMPTSHRYHFVDINNMVFEYTL
jgi:hypothetical protein